MKKSLKFISLSSCLLCATWAQAQEPILPEIQIQGELDPIPYRAKQTAVASKLPQTVRDIPQSVSALTRAQMDDQNMVTVWDALSQITGVQAVSNDLTQGQYHARGSSLESQNDGAPSGIPLSGYQQFDLAAYERIEVLRGPAGLLQGSGSFSGTVNFVRKRAPSENQAMFTSSYGSWNNHRLEADIGAPLNEAKNIRARLVGSYQDRDYTFNRVHDRKWLVYGTLDFDLGDSTHGSVYMIHQHNTSTGFSGLPSYTDGRFLNVSRSFNPSPDFNRTEWETTDIGAELVHQFSNGWQATARVGRRDQQQFFHDSYPTTGVNPITGVIGRYARREFDYDYLQHTADVYVGGPFSFLGRNHELLIGGNYSHFQSTGRGANPNSPNSTYLNYDNVPLADPPSVPDVNVVYRTGSQNVTTQSGLYGRITLNVADPLKLIFGGRWSNYDYRSRTISPHTSPTDWAQGGQTKGEFTPYFGAVYTLNPSVNLYASYADIFVPQTQKRVDGSILAPRVGRQFEFGSKTELFDGRLSANAAIFSIRDTHRALADADNPGYFVDAGALDSHGWELELVGKLLPNWDISGGYTNLITRWRNNGSNTGKPVSYWYPRHLYKLWTRYQFNQGVLAGASIGVGVQGASRSASGAASDTIAAREQNSYATVKLQLGYQVNKQLGVTLDINNLFDTKYYTRLGGTNTYNTYGDPLNVALTLRARY